MESFPMVSVRTAVAAFAFLSTFFFVLAGFDVFVLRIRKVRERYLARVETQLEEMFLSIQAERLLYLTLLGMLLAGASGFLAARHLWGGLCGAAAGFALPRILLAWAKTRRKRLFNAQLVESITLMANGLRAGFSLLQGLDLVVREMKPPIRDEFGLLLNEHRLGKPLDEALEGMRKRVGGEDLGMVVEATLVARETGGNIAVVYGKIAETIRERDRMLGKIASMTAQGKMQGWVVGLMPIGLLAAFRAIEPGFLAPMFRTPLGRFMLGLVVFLELAGALLLRRIVRIRV